MNNNAIKNSSIKYLDYIPVEIQTLILSWLDLRSLNKCLSVSKDFNSVTKPLAAIKLAEKRKILDFKAQQVSASVCL